MATKNPTNYDLYKALGVIDEKLEQVHHQVKRTNGRVTELERWKASKDTIEAYIDRHPSSPQSAQEKTEEWTKREKSLIALLVTSLGIIATLVGTGVIKP